MRLAKIQISLRIRAVWSESSTGAFWIAKDAKVLHADNEDSDHAARMRTLIWVFIEWTHVRRYAFSQYGSYGILLYIIAVIRVKLQIGLIMYAVTLQGLTILWTD